jgi:hypothetical protein
MTDKQKHEIKERIWFWLLHAIHWYGVTICLIITFGIFYTFWGNDAVFASAVLGG